MYVVEALRNGNRENHSYVVGIYSTLRKAALAAVAEEYWRGSKYECYVHKFDADEVDPEKEKFLMSCCVGDDFNRLDEDIQFVINRTKAEFIEE